MCRLFLPPGVVNPRACTGVELIGRRHFLPPGLVGARRPEVRKINRDHRGGRRDGCGWTRRARGWLGGPESRDALDPLEDLGVGSSYRRAL